MALTDLASLKAEMRDWALDRPDLVGKFQDCIDMCDQRPEQGPADAPAAGRDSS